MKKKISIVLSVLMMASALGACGGKTPDAPAGMRTRRAKPRLIPERPRLRLHFPVP